MNVKNLVLGIGIVVVFALVLWQGIETFYPSPQYENYCNMTKSSESIYNVSSCDANGGRWIEDAYPRPTIDNKTVTGYCDMYYQCGKTYESAMTSYSWKVFLVSLSVGVILLLLGLFVVIPEPVASSIIGGAVWAIFWGSVINWRNFGASWKFILLLLVLGLLIGLALRFNRKEGK